MKKVLTFAILIFASVLTFACKDGAKAQPNEPEQKEAKSGEVIVMNKDMFIKDVFDYEKSQDWKYKGDKPAIIDLYADWCGPCRMTAPIMKDLAKEYAGKIVIYKVNVWTKNVNLPHYSMQAAFLSLYSFRWKENLSFSVVQLIKPLTKRQLKISC